MSVYFTAYMRLKEGDILKELEKKGVLKKHMEGKCIGYGILDLKKACPEKWEEALECYRKTGWQAYSLLTERWERRDYSEEFLEKCHLRTVFAATDRPDVLVLMHNHRPGDVELEACFVSFALKDTEISIHYTVECDTLFEGTIKNGEWTEAQETGEHPTT